jgi:hypothetical protein
LPKQGRLADTIHFIGAAVVGTNQGLAMPIAELLEEIAILPAIEQGMSIGTAGNETSRKYRRAMILILAALGNISVDQARAAVSHIQDAALPGALGNLYGDVQRIKMPARLNPALHQLQAAPTVFLAANRIKIGRGALTTSIPTPYEFSWNSRSKFYLMEPPNPIHTYLHVTFNGFNIAVTDFSDVQHNLGAIPGAVVNGTMGLTTQLSGCSILYSVNGGNLVVAHVWPRDPDDVRANLPPALLPNAAIPVGALLSLRIADHGDLANPVAGGTFGIFGMVASQADTGLRHVGARNIRMHGYVDTLGNAYFIAVQTGGNWELFGQQNAPNNPNGGVSNFMQLYP